MCHSLYPECRAGRPGVTGTSERARNRNQSDPCGVTARHIAHVALPRMTLRMTVLGTGYLGATHAACMAELGYEVLGVDVDAGQDRGALRGTACPSTSPGSTRSWRATSPRAACASRPATPRPRSSATCTSSGSALPQKKGEFAADVSALDAVIDNLAPLLTRPTIIAGKSTVPVGTGRPAGRPGPRARPGGRGRRALLEPRVPARGLRGRGHAAPRPAGDRRSRPARPYAPRASCARSTHRCSRPTPR